MSGNGEWCLADAKNREVGFTAFTIHLGSYVYLTAATKRQQQSIYSRVWPSSGFTSLQQQQSSLGLLNIYALLLRVVIAVAVVPSKDNI